MGKPPKSSSKKLNATQLRKLQRERRALARRMAKLESEIEKLEPPSQKQPEKLTPEEVDRFLDEMSEGLNHLPPLPDDFSRADIYDDEYFDRLR